MKNNKTEATDPNIQTSATRYDASNFDKTDAEWQHIAAQVKATKAFRSIDAAGNRTTVTDAKNNVATYGYNEFNKVSSYTNPLTQTIQFGYDKNGNTTKALFPKGDTVSNTYNALNRMDGMYYNKKWGLAYDASGNLTSATDGAGKATNYTFDKNNRLTVRQKLRQ